MITRRAALAGLTAAAGLAALTACAGSPAPGATPAASPRRIAYGTGSAQFGELTRPKGASRGTVVVIHGGYWQSQYDLSLGRPLAADLAGRGFTTWNLEYRRVGDGGGVPRTLDDVAAGIDHLASIDGVDTTTLIALGHSAGGHLAAWAAARPKLDRWTPKVPLTHVISQAGVLDLRSGEADRLGGGAVRAFLGDTADDDQVDPTQQLPLGVPVWAVHGSADTIVPFSQSEDYVRRATAAGGTATLVTTDGDHFANITTSSPTWSRTLEIFDEIAPRR